MTKLDDTVNPGEEAIEALWKEQKGCDPETGLMWLTPRMERIAAKAAKEWEEMEKKQKNDLDA